MFTPTCLTHRRAFATWAEAVIWSATCDGHPYVVSDGCLWVVHYLKPWILLDDDGEGS